MGRTSLHGPRGHRMARILVVDDSREIRTVLRQALEHVGHRVDVAEDGWKAMVGFRARGADLVIMDLLSPGAELPQTISELRSMSGRVKILAMSRQSELGGNTRQAPANALGVDGAICKPFRLVELLLAVDGLVPRRGVAVLFGACQ